MLFEENVSTGFTLFMLVQILLQIQNWYTDLIERFLSRSEKRHHK